MKRTALPAGFRAGMGAMMTRALLAARDGGQWVTRAEEFGRRKGVPGELLVRLTPTRMLFEEKSTG